MYKLNRYIGTMSLTNKKTGIVDAEYPFDIKTSSSAMIKVHFKMQGVFDKYNTNNYYVNVNVKSKKKLNVELDYGMESICKVMEK